MTEAHPDWKSRLWAYVAESIKAARLEAGMSQEQLAALVGLSRASIANAEKGWQRLPLHVLYDVAISTGVEVADLLPELWELAGDTATEPPR